MRSRVATCLLLAAAATSSLGWAQTRQNQQLTLAGARSVMTAAVAEAHRLGAPGGAIAVVDAGGDLMALERLDGSFPASARIAHGKASTAAQFQRETKVFEDLIVDRGRVSMTALAEFTPLQGGVPIVFDGQVLGAIGVSGAASAAQDTEIAVAGAAASGRWSAGGPQISHFSAGEVEQAFDRGAALIEVEDYKIHTSRREGPGRSEVHEDDTDIFYFLEGSAVVVTGGSMVDPETVAPREIRGSAIRGGEERRVSAGDVIVVPRGTPHWFREVSGPVLYYTVKVTG